MEHTEQKRRVLAGCARVIAFILLLAFITMQVSEVLKDKNNYLKYSAFYTEKEPFDVLFFGSSRMLNAVYPMELWENYGITSYNMAQHSEILKLSYWQMKNAFQYNKPKVAVVEVSLFAGGYITDEDGEAKSYLHKSIDHMKFTPLKYELLKDITKGVDFSEYLFPLTIYHNRWNELEGNDIYRDISSSKGAERRRGVTPMERMEWSNQEKSENFDPKLVNLDAMVELCKKNDVQLILTCMPTVWVSGNPGVCSVMNYLEEYASEQGIFFLNFAKEENYINYATDFYDSSHLNPSGASKITEHLGSYLIQNFDLPAEKEESTVKAWNKRLAGYNNDKKTELQIAKNAGDLHVYLMLLNDEHFTFRIKLSDREYVKNQVIEQLLSELGVTEQDIIIGEVENGNAEITVYDRDSGEETDKAVFQ